MKLNDREFAAIARNAASARKPLAIFAREAALGVRVHAAPSDAFVRAYAQLAPLQSNVNQIAHQLNTAAQLSGLIGAVAASDVELLLRLIPATYAEIKALRMLLVGINLAVRS